MKNKLFLAGIIIILILGIVGLGCDGGADIGGGIDGGGSGGGGSPDGGGGSGDSGDDVYDGSGGSGSGDGNYEDNRGGSVIYIWGGSGRNRSRHTVKFKVTASYEETGSPVSGITASVTYSYPDENFKWSTGSSGTVSDTFKTTLPWDKTVSVSNKVIGNGIGLSANIENTSIWLTAEIYVDGKKRTTSHDRGKVTVFW